MKKKIGIIGNGFVGNAIYEGMRSYHDTYVYDKVPERCPDRIQDVDGAKYIFISVPTPMRESGEIDLAMLRESIRPLKKNKILIIKSTITPAGAEELIEHYPCHDFVFNPEFLTERTSVEDFKKPSRIVLGGDPRIRDLVKDLYLPLFPDAKYIETDHRTACFIKYASNCFSAVKISIMNEFKQMADKDGINWDDTIGGMLSSGWINPMHTLVPGTDGKFGFGGKCFPKDINAFINYACVLGIEPKILKSSWAKNLEVRKDRDWLIIPGAVVDKT